MVGEVLMQGEIFLFMIFDLFLVDVLFIIGMVGFVYFWLLLFGLGLFLFKSVF